jgi:Putative zinc-finger
MEMLADYASGELLAEGMARLVEHFAHCPSCRRDAALYLWVTEHARSLSNRTLPPDIERRLEMLILDQREADIQNGLSAPPD